MFAIAAGGLPSASPSPSASPPALKEIGVVNAVSPYCASFYDHFNAAVRPMLVVDRELDHVSASLDEINTLFSKIDWDLRFYDERLKLERYVAVIETTNYHTQQEINKLRSGEKLTSDPERARQVHMLAQELQRALDKQKQIGWDIHSMIVVMMDFPIGTSDLGRPLNGFDPADLRSPKDARDIKAVLRFNGMRDRLRDAQGMAAGYAATIGETYC